MLPGYRQAGPEAARPGEQGHEHDPDILRRHVHRGLRHPAVPTGVSQLTRT